MSKITYAVLCILRNEDSVKYDKDTDMRWLIHPSVPSYNNDQLRLNTYCSLTNTAAIPIPLPMHMDVTNTLPPVCLAMLRPVAT